jgi:hypothetical protein
MELHCLAVDSDPEHLGGEEPPPLPEKSSDYTNVSLPNDMHAPPPVPRRTSTTPARSKVGIFSKIFNL